MQRRLAVRLDRRCAVDQELVTLLHDTRRYGEMEAALRLRALGEIAEVLNTDALVELASLVVSRTMTAEVMRPQRLQS